LTKIFGTMSGHKLYLLEEEATPFRQALREIKKFRMISDHVKQMMGAIPSLLQYDFGRDIETQSGLGTC